MKPQDAKTYPFRGGFHTIKYIAEKMGMPVERVRYRIKNGKSLLLPPKVKIGDGAVVRADGRRSSFESHQKRAKNHRVAQRARKGVGLDLGPDEVGCNVPKPVTIEGRWFKSRAAAARHFAVSECTVRRTIKRLGTSFKRSDLRNHGAPRRTCPGTLDGIEYPSMAECARQTGIDINKVRQVYKKNPRKTP